MFENEVGGIESHLKGMVGLKGDLRFRELVLDCVTCVLSTG